MDKHYSISAYSPEENYLVAIIKDVTIRKKAENELVKSQHMLRTILDNVPQRVFWKDSDSIFRGCNIHFAKDLGFDSPDEIIGKTDFEVDYENLAEEFISCDRYPTTQSFADEVGEDAWGKDALDAVEKARALMEK